MTRRNHVFEQDLEDGKRCERVVAKYLDKWFEVEKADLETEKQQRIDFIATQRDCGRQLKVEVKMDRAAGETENLFFETECDGKISWGYTCQADIVFTCVPALNIGFVFSADAIRANIAGWAGNYELKEVWSENHGRCYTAHGVCVPLRIARTFAICEIYLPLSMEVN